MLSTCGDVQRGVPKQLFKGARARRSIAVPEKFGGDVVELKRSR